MKSKIKELILVRKFKFGKVPKMLVSTKIPEVDNEN
jgi:hypothetical protein